MHFKNICHSMIKGELTELKKKSTFIRVQYSKSNTLERIVQIIIEKFTEIMFFLEGILFWFSHFI